MQQYRMRPYFVEAMIYTGENAPEIIAAFGRENVVLVRQHDIPCIAVGQQSGEDTEYAYPGDYVYRDQKRVVHCLWACAFEHHFEVVD